MRALFPMLLLAGGAMAQPPAPLSFEVASIKPATPPKPGESRGSSTTPAGINWQSSLRFCIAYAYGVKEHQVAGPPWLADARFEIVAKPPAGAREADFPEMMRTLLNERFKLSAHREEKEYSGFALVAGKDGPRLTPAAAPPAGRGPQGGYMQMSRIRLQGGGGGSIEYRNVSMEQLARNLTGLLGRPVLDETALSDRYDVALEYTAFDIAGGTALRVAGASPPPPDADPGVSIFTSIQKLGLTLEPRKLPGDLIVVEHIEKTPTEN